MLFSLLRYCKKRTTAIECMNTYANEAEACLDPTEIEHKTTFTKIIINILNFVCHKDGDQIALFIAEKGPECFRDKQDVLRDCFNSTLNTYVPNESATIASELPKLIMGPKQCQ